MMTKTRAAMIRFFYAFFEARGVDKVILKEEISKVAVFSDADFATFIDSVNTMTFLKNETGQTSIPKGLN